MCSTHGENAMSIQKFCLNNLEKETFVILRKYAPHNDVSFIDRLHI
jgi:hypothetical protein